MWRRNIRPPAPCQPSCRLYGAASAGNISSQLTILQTAVFLSPHHHACSRERLHRIDGAPRPGTRRKRINGQASRRISIGKLHTSRRVHIRPINLVIFQEPSGVLRPGTTHLVEGFTLRCFQHFSLPHLATERYPWRDNSYTRGASNPVLSY